MTKKKVVIAISRSFRANAMDLNYFFDFDLSRNDSTGKSGRRS